MTTPNAIVPERFIPVQFPAEADWLLALDFAASRLAVSWRDADDARVFNTATGKVYARPKGFHRVSGVGFLSARDLLVTAYTGCCRCALPRGARAMLSDQGWQTSITVSPSGSLVALGAAEGIRLLDVGTGQSRALRAGNGLQCGRWASFSPGERYVAAELGNEADRQPSLVAVWEVASGRRQRVFDTEAHALAFRGDTLGLALADDHGQLLLYEPDQGEEPAKKLAIEQPGTYDGARALQYRDQGRTLGALMSNGHFLLFDAETGAVLRHTPPPPGKALWGAVSSADWSAFAAAAKDGVMIWPGDPAETT